MASDCVGVQVCVCVSTCYIIKRGGREHCLACHTTATRSDKRGRDGVSERHSTTRHTLVWRHSNNNVEPKAVCPRVCTVVLGVTLKYRVFVAQLSGL